jgi:hypothetical protein
LVGVTAGEFFAVLFEFEDGVAILSGEGPFPDARVRIAAKSGESREGEGGEDQHETFHNSNALNGLEIERVQHPLSRPAIDSGLTSA